ncbi:hypothetical protein ABTC54_19395, partial [Acinetobacter baumannii]
VCQGAGAGHGHGTGAARCQGTGLGGRPGPPCRGPVALFPAAEGAPWHARNPGPVQPAGHAHQPADSAGQGRRVHPAVGREPPARARQLRRARCP